MRTSIVLLLCSLAGILGGGALIGTWALGVCLIFCSLCAGGWALFHDDGTAAQPAVHQLPGMTLKQVFDRARAS